MCMDRRSFLRCAGVAALSSFAGQAFLGKSAYSATPTKLILGRSRIVVPAHGMVGTQVDRVIRDIALKDSLFDSRRPASSIPSERAMIVPYMEGRLSQQLMDYADARIVGLTPAFGRKKGELFYADNGEGDYPFLIDASKVAYESVAFSRDGVYGFFPDTHGFNMVAGQALRLQKLSGIDLAIACLDLPAKADGALYLAEHGINCFGPCDSVASMVFGYRTKVPNGTTIMGTAPIRPYRNGSAIIGAQEVRIDISEPIVVQATYRGGIHDHYCNTPRHYFTALCAYSGVPLTLTPVEAYVGQAGLVVNAARKTDANVIGVRVFNKQDAAPVVAWLEEDRSRRAILFHSAPYEEGYALFFRFPKQTSFGDLDPVFF